MKKFAWLLCMVFLVLATSVLSAQKTEDPCKGEENQMNMNLCAAQQYQEADDALNATWKSLLGHMEDAEKAEIRKVQTLWLKFRDAQVAYEIAPWEGGSMQPMIRYGCLKRLTEQRTDDLKILLEQYEN